MCTWRSRRVVGSSVQNCIYKEGNFRYSKAKSRELRKKANNLIEVIQNNPYQTPPRYEKLLGDFKGAYSRRINIKHKLIYEVFENDQMIKIITMWTHYEF